MADPGKIELIDLTVPPSRDAQDIARDGGMKGATIKRKGRTGEQAVEDWEKQHGSLDEPTYKRKQREDEVGEV